MSNLTHKKCIPCEENVQPLSIDAAKKLLLNLKDWQLSENGKTIFREFKFKNFHHTMSFVNAIAFIANNENHHPDLKVGYNYCKVTYSTHSIDGLSENDFICATKINALL